MFNIVYITIFPFGLAGFVQLISALVDVMLVMFGAARPCGSSETVEAVTGGLVVHPADVQTSMFITYVVTGCSDVITVWFDLLLNTFQ